VKIELKLFQEKASEDVLAQMRAAQREIAQAGSPQAVVLSAPTGCGKTMVITDVIEKVLAGYGDQAPDPDASFLWLTDQPELNEQTKKKMSANSSVLSPFALVSVDASFDEETFRGGNVYFLNTQKIGRDRSLTEVGDERAFTLWDTVANTVRENGTHFHLIIDEAHRGMAETPREREQANSIVQKFIKGSPGEILPIPLIVGISATPERFRAVVAGTSRVLRQIDVDPVAVRESGLLKDYVRFRIPKGDASADLTLLKNAAQRWIELSVEWDSYCTSEGEPAVVPILIVQVKDGRPGRLSDTDIAAAAAAIEATTGAMPVDAYAHAFQERSAITLEMGRSVRYLAPSDINDDPDVRVVFFKTSLSTGWDCPRAEVMMSFRKASDATYIAQLVGRMVRTPLARRVERNENLNSVALILPHYSADEVGRVVDQLRAADPDLMPPVDIEDDDDFISLSRLPRSEECFRELSLIPSYVLPGRTRITDTRRLMKLARLLVNDDIEKGAIDAALDTVVNTLDAEHRSRSEDEEFKKIIDAIRKIEIQEQRLTFGADLEEIPGTFWAELSVEDLDDLFAAVGRRIGEGLHKAYWRHRAAARTIEEAKIETIAVLSATSAIESVNAAAGSMVRGWLERYASAIRALTESERQGYDEIRMTARDPQLTTLDMPDRIDARRGVTSYDHHLYAELDGKFHATLNKWEEQAIRSELREPRRIGWLRNLPRKRYSLCVPYQVAGDVRPLYPDLLVFRQTDHGIKVDIVDPHRVDLEDSAPKAAGLARFVDRHPSAFGRVVLMIVNDEEAKCLDLNDHIIRARVKGVTTNQHLRDLYEIL